MSIFKSQLSTFIDYLVEKELFSGNVLLAKGSDIVFQDCYGLANRDFDIPNNIDTKFNLGSMNKMFTAIAIAQLVEQDRISFDDTVTKFLPDFRPEVSSKIKIKHLLTHTSGLAFYFGDKFRNSSRLLYRTIDDMMKLVEEEEILFDEPGSQYQYSNTGMLVLGKIVECVTGQTYYDYIEENVHQIAGMKNSGCFELDKVNKNLAVPYHKEILEGKSEFYNTLFLHVIRGGPHGGGFSNVQDLLKFTLALKGNQFVSEELVTILTSAKPELNSPEYGFGFSIHQELPVVGHAGGFSGIYSNLDIFLDSPWTSIVLSNLTHVSQGSPIGAAQIIMKIREILVSEGEIIPLKT